jgi:hypothetical protein
MTGKDLRRIRKSLSLETKDFALLLGYTGNDRNNDLRIRRLEAEDLVPLYIGRLVWLIKCWFDEHEGTLPYWPPDLRIEGEEHPWT